MHYDKLSNIINYIDNITIIFMKYIDKSIYQSIILIINHTSVIFIMYYDKLSNSINYIDNITIIFM
jgi:hypothetical protein